MMEVCQAVKEINDMMDGYAEMQELLMRKDAECGQKILRLEHENQALQTHLDEATENLEKYKDICHNQSGKIAEMQASLDACGDCMMDNEKYIAELEAEIVRLKAEVYDLERKAK